MRNHTKKLSIAFYWHMHQPVYQLSPDGDYIMPWIRLHAIKDYLDMVDILKKYKNLKLNFNLVPVLLDSIIDYTKHGILDIHARLTLKPIEELNDSDKQFILNNFFDANYQNMILPYEEYDRIYHKIRSNPDYSTKSLTNQEYSDLMALFNLAWFDPTYKFQYPELNQLYNKGKNYTDEDRRKIIEIQLDIMKKIIPTYKEYLSENRIEITTSPYYHPILPILTQDETVNTGNVTDGLNTYEDAVLQTKMAMDRVEEIFGKRPKGIWPSEHCVSPKTVKMLSSVGAKWTIADECVLSDTIGYEFIRDFKGHLEDPYHLVKTYKYEKGDTNIQIVFRDGMLPDLIGVKYCNHNPITAAGDLYDRIKGIQSKLLSSPDANHLLTIAMDGENCWENYIEDGISFLKTIYSMIEEDESLETVLISDYLEKDKTYKKITKISSGSWVNRNFNLWINEPLKNLAWTYLKSVREDLTDFAQKNPNNPHIEYAQKELFICEGSDWFWWYGEPNDSGRDNIFDYIFREHLKNVYLYLGLEVPDYLDEPLTAIYAKPSRYPQGGFTPALDGNKEDDSWLNAGCIDIPDGPILKNSKLFDKICYGYDDENFYLRFYLDKFIMENEEFKKKSYQMYLYTRNATRKQDLASIKLINKTENILPIAKEKFHNELKISIVNGRLEVIRFSYAIQGDLWILENSKDIQYVYHNVVDLKIPFDLMDVQTNEELEFLFVNASFGVTDLYIPHDMLLSVPRICDNGI